MIAECIASQAKANFFNIRASTLIMQWIGEDGEKMIRTLFAVASENQPSIILVEEIESLCQQTYTQCESSQRLKASS